MYCTNITKYDMMSLEANCIQYTICLHTQLYRNDLKGDNAYDTLEKL